MPMHLRRLLALTTATLTSLAVVAGPAWAQPSFTSGGTAEAGATGHRVTMQVPEDERNGATNKVRLTAPSGFVVTPDCVPPVGWSCTVDGRTVTWTSGGLAALGAFGFVVDVPAAGGTYQFAVVQADAAGATLKFSVPMTVTGGEGGEGGGGPTPAPSPDPTTSPKPTGGGNGDAGSGDGTGDGSRSGGDGAGGAGSTTTGGDGDGGAATDGAGTGGGGGTATDSGATGGSSSSSSGSTAPTRTQGTANGTTLEITGGEQPRPDQPAVAAPDVAPGAATTSSARGDAQDLAAADAVTVPGTEGGRDVPWQQVVGGLLLLAGAGVLGAQRWRARGNGPAPVVEA